MPSGLQTATRVRSELKANLVSTGNGDCHAAMAADTASARFNVELANKLPTTSCAERGISEQVRILRPEARSQTPRRLPRFTEKHPSRVFCLGGSIAKRYLPSRLNAALLRS